MSKVTRLPGGSHRGENPDPGLRLGEAPGDVGDTTVGQDLRSARLRGGDELASVARALRIRKEYLEALETDASDKLPGRTYAIGFLRSYAEYLGLDSSGLVSRYKRQTTEPRETPSPDGMSQGRARSRSSLALAAIAFVVLGVAALALYQAYRPQVSRHPGASPSLIAPTAGDRAVGRAPSRPETGTEVAGIPAAALPIPSDLPGKQPVSAPEGQVFGAQNHDARVVLHAHGLAHVLVQGFGGRVYINRLLHPGDVYRVPNLAGLSLTTQNGGAVSVELDGRDMGFAGRSGQIAEAVSLDPGAIAGRRGTESLDAGDKVTP
ncbi:MAG TPA: RodZ domain-containing protein [Rhizomicrobium sp.]